ncbi:MAG: hypothetical protein AAF658_06630, partial [Myxococcota bacterium]
GQMRARRGNAAIAEIPGGFLVSGGINSPGDANSSAERFIFDSAADLCNPTPGGIDDSVLSGGAMLGPRAGHRMTRLIGGDVLSTGGYRLDPSLPIGQRVSLSVRGGELYIISR